MSKNEHTVFTVKQVCETKRQSSELFNSVFLLSTVVLSYSKEMFLARMESSGLKR